MQHGEDDLLRAAATPRVAKLAGGLAMLAGSITALTSVQAFTMMRLRGPWIAAPWALIAAGIAGLAAGTQVYRARSWALTCQSIAAAAALCVSAAWLYHSLEYNIISLFAWANPLLWLAAAALSLAASPACARATAARRRLSARGIGLGL